MKKRFISAVTALAIAATVSIPLSAWAAETADGTNGTCGDNLTWTLDNGTLTISGTGAMYQYSSGSTPWYSRRSAIEEVVIEYGVTRVGNYAFEECSNLASIEIPDSVISLGDHVFYNCSSLESVEIPDGDTSIGWMAFYNCSSLKSIEIPDSVTDIVTSAFYGCSSLENIEIPDSVTSIGGMAFSGCSSLESAIIGNSVTSIGGYAFMDCSSLESIEIPDSVTSIRYWAFYNCSSLESVIIGNSVTSMEHSVFYNCSNLDSVIIGNSMTSIESDVFYNCSSLASINIPDSVTSIGDSAFEECSSLTSIELPDRVTSIGDRSFYNCSSLASINIPDSMTSLGYWAFKGCSSLESIEIPDCVMRIGSEDFSNCSSLASIEIPDSVMSIGAKAFSGCSSLASINIPDGVTSIGDSVFSGCSSLASINIPNGVTSIGDSAFSGCSSLASINIPDGVTSIGDSAFSGCSSLASINIPDGVTSIGSGAFSGCNSLASINIPNGVTSIGYEAFSGCSSLASIEIPDGVTSIGGSAFYGCRSLASVNIPDSVTSIGSCAFDNCRSLESIEIPDSVTSIGSWAFRDCSSLTDVYYVGTEEQWNAIDIGQFNSKLTYDVTIHYNYGKVASTQTTVEKGQNPIKFHAYDSSLSPLFNHCAGVTVEIDGFGTQVTGEDGYLEFENTYTDGVSMDTTFIATKEGYRDYISDIRVYNSEADVLYNNNSVSAMMTRLQPGDEERPYISTFLYISPYSSIRDLLYNSIKFTQSNTILNLKAYAVWNDKVPGKFVLYQEDGAYVESEDGIFNVRTAEFDTDKDIYIKAVAEDGTESMSEKVQMDIYPSTINDSDDSNSVPLFDISGGYTSSDIPFLNDTTIRLDLDVPVTYTIKDGKIRLAVGLIDENNTFADDENWKEWKKVCESSFSHNRTAAEWADDIKNLDFDWTSSVSLDCKAVGYFEVDVTNQNESIEGGINLSADAKATIPDTLCDRPRAGVLQVLVWEQVRRELYRRI